MLIVLATCLLQPRNHPRYVRLTFSHNLFLVLIECGPWLFQPKHYPGCAEVTFRCVLNCNNTLFLTKQRRACPTFMSIIHFLSLLLNKATCFDRIITIIPSKLLHIEVSCFNSRQNPNFMTDCSFAQLNEWFAFWFGSKYLVGCTEHLQLCM